MTGQPKEISLGDDFGEVIVRANGASVEIHKDGSILAHTAKPVSIANDPGKPHSPPALAIGDKMPDGTVFAGVSPDTGKPMYTTPSDAPQPMKWKEAMDYAEKLDAHGHQDWRLPTKGELAALFNSRAAIGGFNVTGSDPVGWYWSGTQGYEWHAWDQRFSDGDQTTYNKDHRSSVRCVR
jgi:uncharacterized protein DUF1566